MQEFRHAVAIVANGEMRDHAQIKKLIEKYQLLIAVDGGLLHCKKMGLKPDMIVGDLDSVDPSVLAEYEDVATRYFNPDKNESDLELAIQAIYTPEVDRVTVFAGLGDRTDHVLANLHLIRRYPQKVFIESEKELIFSITGKTTIPCFAGQTISFIHVGECPHGVTSKGLQWEMRNANFTRYYFSLSNICLADTAEISIQEGDVICCLQKGTKGQRNKEKF